MRILLYERAHRGHMYQYLKPLVPALADLSDDVVFATSQAGRDSWEFEEYIAPSAHRIRVDTAMPPIPIEAHGRGLMPAVNAYQVFRDTIKRIRPDHVIMPSADGPTQLMYLYRLMEPGGGPYRGIRSDGLLHGGMYVAGSSPHAWLRNLHHSLNRRFSRWTTLHLLNVCLYEHVLERGGPLVESIRLVPHPGPTLQRMDKHAAREKLGIPEDGRYIGITGYLDTRKAVRETLEAFFSATSEPTDRLLLAGKVGSQHKRLVHEQYADEVAKGRLVVLDRFLDPAEYEAALNAVDVLCVPYPRMIHFSSVMFEGLAVGRPVLVHHTGWSGEMTRRFNLGVCTNVLSPPEFTEGVRSTLALAESHREGEGVKRLLRYHSPQNYVDHLLSDVRRRVGAAAPENIVSWDWVMEAAGGAAPSRRKRVAAVP